MPVLAPHQVAALCDQAESQTALIRWRALNAPSLPRSAASVAANDLEAIVRPLQSLIDLLRKAEVRPRTRETHT